MYNPKQSVFIYMEHIDTKAEIGRKNISMIIYPLGITRLNLTNNAVIWGKLFLFYWLEN